jgi:hypothetical protein
MTLKQLVVMLARIVLCVLLVCVCVCVHGIECRCMPYERENGVSSVLRGIEGDMFDTACRTHPMDVFTCREWEDQSCRE